MGGVVVGSADTIVISAFLGLTTLAVYQNYYFIMNSICGFITVIFSAITAGIGNSLVTESSEKIIMISRNLHLLFVLFFVFVVVVL